MSNPAAPPPLRNTLREAMAVPRVLLNPLRMPRSGAKIGQGRAVIVIPGLATGDVSTTLLRRTLKARGFAPEGWRLGINTGADQEKVRRIEARVAALHKQTGKKVVLIGWSLGGLYARVIGQRCADMLDMVVTVASPFSGDRHANVAWKLYEAINNHTVDDPPFAEDFADKPPVPTIAIWSGVDGIVAPECSRGLKGEADYTLRIDAPHFTLGTSRSCIEKLLGMIAQVDAERAG